MPSSKTVLRISFALSTTYFLLTALMSSTFSIFMVASHGPTLSIVSRVAAMRAVSLASREDGIIIVPSVFPFFVESSTSILPILPVLCSSLKSMSAPKRPSVWPKTAPITSGFSTTPLDLNFATMLYFEVD